MGFKSSFELCNGKSACIIFWCKCTLSQYLHNLPSILSEVSETIGTFDLVFNDSILNHPVHLSWFRTTTHKLFSFFALDLYTMHVGKRNIKWKVTSRVTLIDILFPWFLSGGVTFWMAGWAFQSVMKLKRSVWGWLCWIWWDWLRRGASLLWTFIMTTGKGRKVPHRPEVKGWT